MKAYIFTAFLLFTGFCFSQETERMLLSGTVTVPAGDDPAGIMVFNTSTNRGSVTEDDGSFRIMAGLRDELRFSALQFEEFTVIIDQAIMDAGELNVFISAGITELPEVSVGAPDLSGNVEVDVRRISVEEAKLPAVSAAEMEIYEWEFRPDEQTSPRNAAMQSSMMMDGLNFANLFRGIYESRIMGSEDFDPIEEDVRLLYDDEYFRENFHIKEKNIYDFLLFAEENGLNEEMLKEGHELDLLEFLLEQSRKYNQQAGD